VGQEVIVELKNEMKIRGTLYSVDQFLNIKLENISVLEEEKYPHMVCKGLPCGFPEDAGEGRRDQIILGWREL
jgi:U6 snRNA-associated Sm-like protein LSm2